MEVEKIVFPSPCFLLVKLDKDVIEYLWKIIDTSKLKSNEFKKNLAGNITQSYKLIDENDYFYKKVLIPLINNYRNNNNGDDPVKHPTKIKSETPLLLKQFWVNYQYETEFNPYHDHTGAYSFAIWLKIPYDCKEQKKLPQFLEVREGYQKAGKFEFEYTDTLGIIRNLSFSLSQDYEGSMVFFPARLRHCVYPFYATKEPRISLAGNLIFEPYD